MGLRVRSESVGDILVEDCDALAPALISKLASLSLSLLLVDGLSGGCEEAVHLIITASPPVDDRAPHCGCGGLSG